MGLQTRSVIIIAVLAVAVFFTGHYIGSTTAMNQCFDYGVRYLESRGVDIPLPDAEIKMAILLFKGHFEDFIDNKWNLILN